VWPGKTADNPFSKTMASSTQNQSKRASPAAAAKRSAKRGAPKLGRGFGASSVYEGLREDILSLRLQPGTLLDETELAGRFKVSRSPVREALIRLSGEGLVQTLRNRSSIVAPFDVALIQSHLNAMVLMYCLTARLAAANRTAAQLEELRAMVRSHRAEMQKGDRSKLVANNRDFHVAIAVAGGNPFFVSWMTTVLDQGQRLMGLYLEDVGGKRPDAMLDEHVAIVEAIAAANPDAAEKAARDDAKVLFDQLQKHLFKDQLRGADLGALTRTR
jgi:DNA-binding GntR family transcriptional regulator